MLLPDIKEAAKQLQVGDIKSEVILRVLHFFQLEAPCNIPAHVLMAVNQEKNAEAPPKLLEAAHMLQLLPAHETQFAYARRFSAPITYGYSQQHLCAFNIRKRLIEHCGPLNGVVAAQEQARTKSRQAQANLKWPKRHKRCSLRQQHTHTRTHKAIKLLAGEMPALAMYGIPYDDLFGKYSGGKDNIDHADYAD